LSEGGYLLDTNVISESRQKRPSPSVAAFLGSIEHERVCVSVLTIGELRKGAAAKRRSDQRRADDLSRWIDSVEASFANRLLSVDKAVARIWGELLAERPRPIVDTLIAATAIAHSMTLVTRNTADLHDTGVVLVDPWKWKV
jgi:predicted nucleic acid-binding protein